ncbi:MAG TPA: S8 family serine peptidase, partial [Cytophagaceae bacterium]
MLPLFSVAQEKKYLIYFTDKNNSTYSIDAPHEFLSARAIERRTKQNIAITESDLPVSKKYIDSIKNKGANVLYTSRWFNAALIETTPDNISNILALDFVKSSDNLLKKSNPRALNEIEETEEIAGINENYGNSYNQVSMLGADMLHAKGYKGEGMLIAVIDAGFQNVNLLSAFDSLFANGQIKATYDFVSMEENVYDNHNHGTNVLSAIAGYLDDELIGTAYKADFLLLRTENVTYEYEVEEVYWLLAAEYADSAGADIINSSLGYSTFDDSDMDHSYDDMDGNTTIITRAADRAAAAGILVVTSAGNEGNTSWNYIVAPADGDSVLAVGAVDANKYYASLSSKGPSSDGRIKPDVAAQGSAVVVATHYGGISTSSGTSFAAPLMAGFAALLWQANPELTNMELMEMIKKLGSNYTTPDNFIGYGIPKYIDPQVAGKTNASYTFFPNPFIGEMLGFYVRPEYQNIPVTVKVYDTTGKQVLDEYLA